MKNNWKYHAASIAVCGIPLIHYCYVLVFWLLASAALGHRAQPYVNDPKGFLFGVPVFIAIVLMLASFAGAPLAVFLGYKRRKIALHIVAYAVFLGISIGLFRLDFLDITTWIAD